MLGLEIPCGWSFGVSCWVMNNRGYTWELWKT